MVWGRMPVSTKLNIWNANLMVTPKSAVLSSQPLKKKSKAHLVGKRNCRTLLQGMENKIFNEFWDAGDYNKQNVYIYHSMEELPKKRPYPKKTKKTESSGNSTFNYFVKLAGQPETISIAYLNPQATIADITIQTNAAQLSFYEKARFPRTVGAIDCTHIRIQSPGGEDAEVFRNRKGFFSVNTQIVAAADETILNLVARWPGSAHDMTIFNNSLIRRQFEGGRYPNCLLLGDSGYAAKPYLLTPLLAPDTQAERRYSEAHIRTRNVVERTIGIWKRRFPILAYGCRLKLSNTLTIIVATAQALPVPYLTTGPAFYLRKAWVYNLGIHDCVNDKGYMYMWCENTGKRGSDEIASILFKHFKERGRLPRNLIIYTDNCGGQNKNWVLISLWKQLVTEGVFESIEHRFLLVGHTHRPKEVKKTNPFEVTIIKREDLLSFKVLEENITKKKFTDDKENVAFSKICIFRFDHKNPNLMKIKHFLGEDFQNVNVGRRGIRKRYLADCLKQKYTESIQLNPKKLRNLSLLLPCIPAVSH
nr:unnamed protein product [Callosobruchus chinensis]